MTEKHFSTVCFPHTFTMLGLLKTIFRQISISKNCIIHFKLFPTISRGFGYLKMTNLNTFSAIALPQCFTYNNAFFHFSRNNKVLLSTTFSISHSRRKMGDFGRQISQKYENSMNLLQFSLLQHAWNELEVRLFLKRMNFTE